MGIEAFLDLTIEGIERRMAEEKIKIPTFPGTGYLKLRLKRFETPEWKLIIYLAHNNPSLLSQALNQYSNYGGNDSREVILEGLREYYIFGKLLSKYQEKSKKKK